MSVHVAVDSGTVSDGQPRVPKGHTGLDFEGDAGSCGCHKITGVRGLLIFEPGIGRIGIFRRDACHGRSVANQDPISGCFCPGHLETVFEGSSDTGNPVQGAILSHRQRGGAPDCDSGVA